MTRLSFDDHSTGMNTTLSAQYTVLAGRTTSKVILEVGDQLHLRTKVFTSAVQASVVHRLVECLPGAQFRPATTAGSISSPSGAHAEISPGAWVQHKHRIESELGWTVWDVPHWVQTPLERMDQVEEVAEPLVWPDGYETRVWTSLFEYQRSAVRRGVELGGRLWLADEMGLGKTRTALALVAYFAPATLLVVAPSALRYNWVHEARDWFPGMVALTTAKQVETVRDDGPKVAVVSYALLAKLRARFEYVVFDESHYLKNAGAQRSKTALRVARQARFVTLLSGTPLSRNQDVFSQARLLGWDVGPQFFPYQCRYGALAPAEFFAYRYTVPEVTYTPREVVGFSRNARAWELHALLAAWGLVRRTKVDVAQQLPPKLRAAHCVGRLSATDAAWFTTELQRGAALDGHAAEAHLMRLVVRTSEIKRARVGEYLAETLPALEGQILIFAHFHATLDMLVTVLERAGLTYVHVDGRCSAAEKQVRVSRFQQDQSVRVALLGIKCAGTGLNLQTARHVVFAELGWNPDDHLQAEDRAHRVGSTVDAVHVSYLLLPGTTDELMWNVLHTKHRNTAEVLHAKPATFLGKRPRDPGY